MGKKPPQPTALSEGLVFAAVAEASVAEVEQRDALGMGAIERAQAARVRAAVARLRECVQRLSTEPLLVDGSTGQVRPHPLLKLEAELRKEIDTTLKELVFRAGQGAMRARANALVIGDPETEAPA